MTVFSKIGGAIVACLILFGGMTTTAHAIECKGQYQIVRGHGLLATPYCQDNYLAAVAREYGYEVSNIAIRQNPNKKQEVCRFIGSDNRVSHICATVDEGGRDRRF